MTFIKGDSPPKHRKCCPCFRCTRISHNKGIRKTPLDVSRILFDKQDKILFDKYPWIIEKRKDGKEYLVCKIGNKKKIYFHRLVLEVKNSQFSDHINGNGLDNRRHNLRIVTNAQNNYNRRPKYRFKGVFFIKRLNKYLAQIMFKRKSIYLGVFERPEDAAIAYNNKAQELFGEFAWLNKI